MTLTVARGHSLRGLPGQGVLARYGDLVLLCEAAPEPRVRTLIDAVAATAAAGAGGRELSRLLAGLLGAADDFPALCAFGPAEDGIAVLVSGRAGLTITTDGLEYRLDGRNAVTMVDRVLDGPVESIHATLGDRSVDPGTDRWSRLDAGVVRADALVYQPTVLGTPVVPTSPAEPAPAPPAGPEPATLGVGCKNGHFNDPAVAFCALCGSSMAQASRVPVWGSRPPLGVLVFDDGTTYALTQDQVVGRAPDTDEAVAAGQARPVPLRGPLVSRLHARLVLRDWQVGIIDTGSANGTYLQPHGHSDWTRLVPGAMTALVPGTSVAIGGHRVRYFSHRGP